jgi:hypothetical protein
MKASLEVQEAKIVACGKANDYELAKVYASMRASWVKRMDTVSELLARWHPQEGHGELFPVSGRRGQPRDALPSVKVAKKKAGHGEP